MTRNKIPDCIHKDKTVYSRGMCVTCYKNWYYHTPKGQESSKAYRANNHERLKAQKRLEWKSISEEDRIRRAVYFRNAALGRKYGITIEQYEQMVTTQNGVCDICGGTSKKGLVVDHNHTTKKVRSLLCVACNAQLGTVEDRNFVRTAEEYLRKYGDYYGD